MTITFAFGRHAKSDWGIGNVRDHDRPLNARGTRDAPQIAHRLIDGGFRPDTIVSSTAVRARTTAEFYADALDVPLRLDANLYGADDDTLLQVASESGSTNVLLVAHDPGLSVLAYRITGKVGEMPTCGVVIAEWDTDDWEDVRRSEPTRWQFIAPKVAS